MREHLRVGDIQGCLHALKCVMKKVRFSPDKDILWSVGDIVNRGPRSLKTLRYLYDMRDNLVLVLGNHDLHCCWRWPPACARPPRSIP